MLFPPRAPLPNHPSPAARPGACAGSAAPGIALVSHELRTPLNAIAGFCALAQASGDPATRDTALAQIAQATQLMRRLVDDLLDLEQLGAGQLPLQPAQPLDPAALMARVLGLAAGLPTRDGVQLHARLDDEVPDTVPGDPQRLTQILLNLLANAMRHTDHGLVQLGLRLHRPQAGAPPVLRWSVADTGIGMRPDDLHRLARPFTQVGHDPQRHRGGSGLGLALVNALLARQGAALHWASMPGGGTMVWFDLPLQAAAPTDPDGHEADTPAPRQQHLAAPRPPAEPGTADTRPAGGRPPPARPCTALLRSDDPRLAATLGLRWRAQGQRLLAVSVGAWSRLADVALGGITHWLIDDRLPEAEQAAAAEAASQAGATLWRIQGAAVGPGAGDRDARGTPRVLAALAEPPAATFTAPGEHRPHAGGNHDTRRGAAAHATASASATGDGRAESAPRPAPATACGPVLVVEDDLPSQRMTAALLQHLGLACRVAGSLAEAARLARAQAPALVLLDRQLPDGDGLDWLAPPRPAEAPVVVTSAHADDAARAEARRAGALAVLPKPITLDTLRAVLGQAGMLPAPAADAAAQPAAPTATAAPSGAQREARSHAPAPDTPVAARSVDRATRRGPAAGTGPATAPALPDLTPLFVQQRPALLAPIEAAWAAADTGTLARAVHALRGPLAWLPQATARRAARLAREVEDGLLHGRHPGDLPVPDLLRQTWAVQACP